MDGFWRALLIVMIAGGSVTFAIEILQYFSQSRHSSLVDAATNLTGALIGVAFKIMYDTHLKKLKRTISETFE
jgi:VanZ family protein